MIGKDKRLWKIANEAVSINGIYIVGTSGAGYDRRLKKLDDYSFDQLIEKVDAVFIESDVHRRYEQIKYALKRGKHVLCCLPMAIGKSKQRELLEIAKE